MRDGNYLIGICDDDELYRNRVSTSVRLMCRNMGVLYELKTYDSVEAVLSEEDTLDILFLDEELADGKDRKLNGKDVRADFEYRNLKTLIICITSYEEYMQDSFGMGVMGFITKGSRDEQQRLISIFQRCMEKLKPTIKVAYIEARKHNIAIVSTDGEEKIVCCSIETAEAKCREKNHLVRCQRSYIINLECVDKVIGNFDKFLMKDGMEISISRSSEMKQAMKSAYLSYKERQMSELFGNK